MPLLPGTRFGPYEISAPLGAGGMGEVYRAHDTRLNRDVALKVLPEDLARDPARRQRFEQEARAVAALNHPNIVAVYDVGENYFVSELVEGESLRALGSVPTRRAVDLAIQIADGLAAAHAHGVTHRDLKPENIMVSGDGRAKILDFGLAKVTPAAIGAESATLTQAPHTQEGAVMGTVGYMSPEQVRGRPADPRSDIFSFGLVLHEMLGGKRAFSGESSVEVMSAILKEEPAELPAGIPPGLKRIVEHCLEKSPDRRFQSARDLAFALQSLSASAVTPPANVQAAKPGSRKLLWAAVAGIVLLGALSGVFWPGRSVSSGPLPSFRRLTYDRGFVGGAKFAADGHTILYNAAWNGNRSDLYAMHLDGPDARAFGLVKPVLLGISATGEVALLLDSVHRVNFSVGTLARMPLSGGAPRELLHDVIDACWDPKGEGLAVSHLVNGVNRLEYPIGKVLYQTSGSIDGLHISPGGDRIVFADHPVRGDDRGSIVLMDLTGNKTTLSDGWGSIRGVAWAPAGGEIWFAGNKNSTYYSLWAVSLSGEERLLMNFPGATSLDSVTPTGRVLLSTSQGVQNETVGVGEGDPAEHDLAWLDQSWPTDLSADGKMILFTSGLFSSNYTAFLRRTDGSPPVRLGDGQGESISPDGKWVLADLLSTPAQLVAIPTGAGQTQHVPQAGLVYQLWAQWMPDSKRIVFAANQPGHGSQLWVQSIFPPEPPKAFTGEGVELQGKGITPDGKMVVAKGPDGSYSIYPLDGGAPRPLPGIAPGELFIRWTGDGKEFFTHTADALPAVLYKVDASTGRKQKWREFAPADRAGVIGLTWVFLTPDGKQAVYFYDRLITELQLVEGLH